MKILLFATARDRVGFPLVELSAPCETVAQVRARLAADWPAIAGILPMCAIAVNGEYANDRIPLGERDEIAVIPPVSGGSR